MQALVEFTVVLFIGKNEKNPNFFSVAVNVK